MLDDNDNMFYQTNGSSSWVKLDDISPYVISSIISVEDKNFYSHRGFDYIRILVALYKDIKNKSLDEGASTISQQYIKNLYLTFDKTWKRKIEEAFLTYKLENHYSKDEILEGYLNTINFGSGCFGIEEASMFYFDKHASELTIEEATILVGIPKNPTYYNPIYYFDNAKNRQKVVLNSMVDNKLISREEADEIYSKELTFYGKKDDNLTVSASYYKDAVLKELTSINKIPKSLLESGGLVIYTNLDYKAQENLERIANEEIENTSELEVAAIIRDPKNGAIKALIGGKNYIESEYNRAISSERQVGSTIKPILYYSALSNSMTALSTFTSEKTTFSLGNGETYTPKNYADKYPNKDITMALALALSDNVYAVKTHLFLGTENLPNIAKKMGIKKDLNNNVSSALGTDELNMIDFSNAYSTLANKGILNQPFFIKKVTDLDGNIIYEYKYEEEKVLDERYVYILNEMLKSTYNYSYIDYASPTLLNVKEIFTHKYAVKSGTTDTDYWVVGYTPEALVMVWNGYDDCKRVEGVSSKITKRIWARSIEAYLENKNTTWQEIPSGVTGIIVNPINGSTTDLSKKDIIYFIKGTEPI